MKKECKLFQNGKKSIIEFVDIFPIAEELFNELEVLGVIEKVSMIPHLGDISVRKSRSKTRYDYMMLQLYLNKLIKNVASSHQKYTHNAKVNENDFSHQFDFQDYQVTIADVIQCLVICNNVGHFSNTFTSSKALLLLFELDDKYHHYFVSSFKDERFKQLAASMIERKDYMHFHMLNSLIVLEQCTDDYFAIRLSKEIIYSYLNRGDFPLSEKLEYAFKLFRHVRDISFVAYDLQTSRTPFALDLCNKDALILLVEELLDDYNKEKFAISLIASMKRLLSKTLYNDSRYQICSYHNAEKMCRAILKDDGVLDKNYYSYMFMSDNSPLNVKYSQNIIFDEDGILKITLTENPYNLLHALKNMDNVSVGFYDRLNGKITIIVSLKKTCTNKTSNAFKVFRTVISHLRKYGCNQYDGRYILAVKFLLYYVLGHKVVINPTVNQTECVVCTRGYKNRRNQLQEALRHSIADENANHEVDAILDYFLDDKCNDVCVTVYGSTVVYKQGTTFKEFDGIVVYPNRKTKQLVFFEAKNRRRKKGLAATELAKKFEALEMNIDINQIVKQNHDAYLELNV